MKNNTFCLGLSIASFGMSCFLLGMQARNQMKPDGHNHGARPIKIRFRIQSHNSMTSFMERVAAFQEKFPNTQISIIQV